MTQEEIKQIIIKNQMTYKDFAKYFNLSIDDTIRIFRHLDLKKCSKSESCVNFDGPVQSRQNFNGDKYRRDKLQTQCIYCQKQYYQNNKDYCNQRNRQYWKDNSEHLNRTRCQYRQDNKEYCKQLRRQHYQNNKDYCNQRNRQYYQNNRKYFNQLHYQYQQNNKKYLNQKTKEYKNSFAKFNTFSSQISYAEEIRQDPNNLELLQVKCAYCNLWFNPINQQVQSRINALEGKVSLGTENRFYCSSECKKSCPIYNQILYSKDDPNRNHIGTSREVQSELRQLVFERDNWICQRCDTHKDDLSSGISLHCHHVEGVRHEPLESADLDMCMTVCNECHKEIHQIPGCTYQDMQCKG